MAEINQPGGGGAPGALGPREEKEIVATTVENCYVLVHPLFDFDDGLSAASVRFHEKIESRFLELIDSLRDKPEDVLVIVLFGDRLEGMKSSKKTGSKLTELAGKAKEILGSRAVVTTCRPESVDPVDDGGVAYGKLVEVLKNRGFTLGSSSKIVIGGESSRECVKNFAINVAAKAKVAEPVVLDLALTEEAGMDLPEDPTRLGEVVNQQRPDVAGKLVVKSDWKYS